METEHNDLLPETQEGDPKEYGVRPRTLEEFVGQNQMKKNLTVFINSAIKRQEAIDHILLSGPPGLGKTTMAQIIANQMNSSIRSTSGPVIEKQGDLVAILTNLTENQILFIDEIHRMSRSIEEILYSAMEDFTLDIIIGQGPSARSIKINLPPFTLIGATTRAGMLSSPLRDRFGIPLRFELYEADELTKIVSRSAALLDITIVDEAAQVIGKRSRGTPRIANRLLRRCRDFAEMQNHGVITKDVADETLEKLHVDEIGLDKLDKELLVAIHEVYKGGPVGLNTLAATLGEDKDTLEDVCEPFLLKCGFLLRTSRGRMLSDLGRKHLGIAPEQETIF